MSNRVGKMSIHRQRFAQALTYLADDLANCAVSGEWRVRTVGTVDHRSQDRLKVVRPGVPVTASTPSGVR